jgi:hypothetical protein
MDFYLGHENISRATIRQLQCVNCDFSCDNFSIIGDTEAMNFLGIIGLTNLDSKEVIITHLTKAEFQNYKLIDRENVEARIKKLLNRNNLIWLKRKRDFSEKLFIPCPKCDNKMDILQEISLSQYIDLGGKIYTIGNYPNN